MFFLPSITVSFEDGKIDGLLPSCETNQDKRTKDKLSDVGLHVHSFIAQKRYDCFFEHYCELYAPHSSPFMLASCVLYL